MANEQSTNWTKKSVCLNFITTNIPRFSFCSISYYVQARRTCGCQRTLSRQSLQRFSWRWRHPIADYKHKPVEKLTSFGCRLRASTSSHLSSTHSREFTRGSTELADDEEETEFCMYDESESSNLGETLSSTRFYEKPTNDSVERKLNFEERKSNGESRKGVHTDVFVELRDWLIEGPDTALKFSLASAIFVFVVSVLLRKELPHPSHDLMGLETMDTIFRTDPVTEHVTFWQQFERMLRGPYLPIALTMGFASFTQAFAGFGFAIVAVGILSQFGWIVNSNVFQDIQPIAAVVGALIGWVLVGSQWKKVQWKEITPLLVSCMITTPLGAWGLHYVNHSVSLHVLGSLIFGFVVYSFSGLKLPKKWFANRFAAWSMGGLAGIFGGAFDINGPPLVFYGHAKQWQPDEFKRNVLTVISLNSSFVVICDGICGRLNDYYVGPFLLYSLPFVAFGTYLGIISSKQLGAKRFKQAVLLTCFLMSLRLLTS
eukprot:jgi/Galph1/2685/GphlegSOOS_G1365.1